MIKQPGRSLLTIGILVYGVSFKIFAEPALCSGANAFLSIVDRPSVAESPCTVPNKKVVLELGYQSLKLVDQVEAQNFPSSELRIGFPENSEFYVYLPNYNQQKIISSSQSAASTTDSFAMQNDNSQTITRFSGIGDTTMGIKHIVKSSKKMLLTFAANITPPTGSRYFGGKGEGMVLGVFNYKLTEKLGLLVELSFSSLTEAKFNGGRRYNSFNPDVLLSWSLNDKIGIYGEIYGQSKTSPDQAFGFNMDGGVLCLLAKNLTVDLSGGQRISGQLGSLEHYLKIGMGLLF